MAKTKAEYIAEALAEMEQAVWPPTKWCAAIQDGYPPGKEYNWMVTHNFKAQQALWNAVHTPPTPTPPPSTNVPDPRAQYVVFCAQEPNTALRAKPHYTIAFSADMAYRDGVAPVIAAARNQGHKVAGWCDCRPAPNGTPAAAGIAFVKEFGLDFFIGQAEQAAEFDDAMSVGAKVVIGNLTSLRGDQIETIRTKNIGFIQEDYWNEGWARATSPVIAAYCAGIYPALWNPTIKDYQNASRWRAGDGVYYSATIQDWENLP